MVLIDGTAQELRAFEDQLSDVSTDISIKYFKVFSIIDISYQEYMRWMNTSPFYKTFHRKEWFYMRYKVAINRSYYAIFHAIRAVNIWDGFDASKHSSVIAHFNQFYVHEGKFDRDTYKLIDSAYRIREKCDYSDFFIASKEDAEKQIANAEEFIRRVEKFLLENE